MTTGLDLIGQERQHQFDKGHTLELDQRSSGAWLLDAAHRLIVRHVPRVCSSGHNEIAHNVHGKHQGDAIKELTIAGALIAAVLDIHLHRKKTPEEFWRVDCYLPDGGMVDTDVFNSSELADAKATEANTRGLLFEIKHFKEQV